MVQVLAAFLGEGRTDYDFLAPIIEKTMEHIALQCKQQIDCQVYALEIDKRKKSFSELFIAAAKGKLWI